MKKTLGAALLFALFGAVGCQTDELDFDTVRNQKWILICINDGSNLKVKHKDYHREDAFTLEMEADSFYSLNSDANYAGGVFRVIEDGKIEIDSYGEFSEAHSSDEHAREIVAKLTESLPKVTDYGIKGEHLLFTGPDVKIKFEMR